MAQYLCICVGAYWFSATSFSKWPPGGHIIFFGFWTLWVTWCSECKSSLLWNFNFKLHMHVDGGYRQNPIDFQRRHFQNGRLAAILHFLVSGLLLYFGFEYQLQTSVAQYLCIWVGAYWFSATSFSKWPPGGHIAFLVSGLLLYFGFQY